MAAIAIYNTNTMTNPAGFSAALFNDFINFVDRGEKTTRVYLNNLRQFLAWMRYANINQPERKDIISYRDWLASEHEAISFDSESGWKYRTNAAGAIVKVICKPSTIKGYLQSIHAFFSWTAANNLYPNIAVNIHAPKVSNAHKKDSLTAAEVLTIENSILDRAAQRNLAAENTCKDKAGRTQRSTEQGKRLYAMYLLAVNAGLRTVEISRACIKDLETKSGKTCLYIWGKGHSEADQKKPIAPEVKAAIDDYLQSRTDAPTGNSPLFVSTGNRSKGKRIAPTTISTMLKQAMIEAGFDSERLTAHSLRHSTAQNVMKLTGNNIYQTQQYLRHTSPQTTEIYLDNDSTEQDDKIARQLYGMYHNALDRESNADTLAEITAGMSADKLQQLLAIAQAMK